jgi:hypothetical protein
MALINKVDSTRASLRRRIRQFYELLNEGDFVHCHQMIDPRIRQKPESVTLLQYENSLHKFFKSIGKIKVVRVDVDLHLNEPSQLYEQRDFAVGQTCWRDKRGEEHIFNERWVREGRIWYTRSTGFLWPTAEVNQVPSDNRVAKDSRSRVVEL